MKEREKFQKLRLQKIKFSLRGRLTLLIGVVELVSVAVALGIAYLLELAFPSLTHYPQLIQLIVLSFLISIVAAQALTWMLCEPFEKVRQGMQAVADGDFDVRLHTRSSAKEIQELIAGFNMMAQELRSTEILQTDFVSNVSHEFKTPINAIEGYTTLLQGTDNIDQVEAAYIEKILFNTRRLSSLVSNILLLSKIESQTIQTDCQRYALDEQIREVLLSMEAAWEPKRIDFDVDLESTVYYGSESLMGHVWSNLLSNAIKFSPQGGMIVLRLFRQGEKIVFYVEDRGPGLSEEAQKHIFDKFYQADTSHKEEGNGLGLPLVKRILTNTGGTITAENVPEGGCRFTVILKTE